MLLLGLGVLLLAHPSARSEPSETPEPHEPTVRITSPRGGQTRDRIVTVQGEVHGIEAERLTLVLNGVALSIPREAEGFATPQILAPGWNTIRVTAEAEGVSASDTVSVYAMVPPKDLRVTLTWDTPATDIDLWVTGPDGEKVYYQNQQGKAGGSLDTDVTTGYGPETYTQARLQAGTYRVQAHYYGGGIPTRVRVTIVEGEGSEAEARRTFESVLLKTGDVVEVGELTVAR
jgi:uncharacterized protein YfaP (DUF2135 family)